MTASTHFDVVVVGAGSSGGVIASRLSEDESCSVLLLEAGPDFPDEQTLMPAFAVSSHPVNPAGIPELDWGLWSEPSPDGHRVRLPRGRLVGGSSMINGAVAVRAAPADFDRWAALGNRHWSWNDVLPYFKRIELDHEFGQKPYHGSEGPIHIRRYDEGYWSPVHHAFVEGCAELGVGVADDLNAPGSVAGCVGPWPNNRLNDVRQGTLVTYIRAARSRPNFKLEADATVDQVNFSGMKATGVRYRDRAGLVRDARADLVILAAGVYHSPAILQRSGIGPRRVLDSVGVPARIDLPVGESLSDHANVLFRVQSASLGINRGRTFLVNARGPAGGDGRPVWQALSVPLDESPGHAAIIVNLTRQESLGTVAIASVSPDVPPVIDHRYLSRDGDLAAFLDGWQFCEELLATSPFRREGARDANGDGTGADLIRRTVNTALHPVGSCRMGREDDPTAVVDDRLRVRGVDGLMVADASIFPENICFNTNLTCYVVGEIAAELVRGIGPADLASTAAATASSTGSAAGV